MSAGEVSSQLANLAARTDWDRHAERTLGVARGIYLGLPQGAKLWLRRKVFVAVDQEAVRRMLVLPAPDPSPD